MILKIISFNMRACRTKLKCADSYWNSLGHTQIVYRRMLQYKSNRNFDI